VLVGQVPSGEIEPGPGAVPVVVDEPIVVAHAPTTALSAAARAIRGILYVVIRANHPLPNARSVSENQADVTGRPQVVQNFHPSSSSVPHA
jgi:hypothetical protein